MGLVQNNFRDAFTGAKYYGATLSNNASPYTISAGNSSQAGMRRNLFASQASISALSSIPAGARHPQSILMPQKAGGLASRNNTKITFSETGLGVLGKPISGSSTITFTPTATGGLIVSGSGSASITLSATGTILSVAASSGSASITLSGSALIGALAGLQGTSTITLTPTATIYAIGYLSGISTNEAEFSADALARAVWDALKADYTGTGSMGEIMNSIGASANPWSALLADNNDPDTFGERLQKLLTTAKFIGLK
jgi:hypothetical protein